MRASLKAKVSLTEELADKFQEFSTVAIVDLQKVRVKQVNEARKALRGLVEFRQVKPTLTRFALNKAIDKIPEIEKLSGHIHGMMMLLFSNLDPFGLQARLRKNVTTLNAKAGDVAPDDITVPAGNTGLPPGPVISELNAVGIPTRIDTGSVWITSDTVVARKGTKISAHLAAVLSKLNIAPISSFLVLRAAYNDGMVFESDLLQVDAERTRLDLLGAFEASIRLSCETWYPTEQNASILLARAAYEADVLSIDAWWPTATNMRKLLALANLRASILARS